MTCISPSELDDHMLLAYIDGEADPQVAAHLQRCPHCREKARRLARFQGRLTAQMYRITCPSPLELGEYHLGMLPPAQAGVVAEHLVECLHCRREIAQLTEYLAELEPSLRFDLLEQVKERIRVLVARLISGGPLGQPTLAPALAGMRGGDQEPLIYQAEEIQVVIEIQEETDRPDRRTILGLVIGLGAPQEHKAHLWQAEQRLLTVSVDELGNFALSDIARGSYELMLSGPEVDIHIQDLEIGTSGKKALPENGP